MGPSMLLRARGLDSPFPCSSYGRPPVRFPSKVVTVVDVEHDDQEIIQRVAALDVGKAELVCCVRVPGPGHDDPVVADDVGLAGRPGSDQGGDGSHQRLLEAAVLPAGGLLRDMAGQRQGRQAPAGSSQDGSTRCGVVGQGGRAADAAGKLRTARADPDAAGSDPVPGRPDRRGLRRSSASRSCWKTPRSRSRSWLQTSSGYPVGR